MSKSTTSRLRQRKLENRLEDGVGSLSTEEAEVLLDSTISEGSNSSILDKLGSMAATEREWACSALTHLIREDTGATLDAMDKAGSFTKLVECLCDTEPLVVFAALGAVHACTVSGDQKSQMAVAKVLVEKDVMSPLIALCAQTTLSADDTPENISFRSKTLSRLIAVLCNMSSLNDLALNMICSPQLAPAILAFSFAPLQNRDLHTPEIMIYAVQLISILTEIDDEETPNNTRLALANFKQLFNQDHLMLLKVTMANGNNPILLRALIVNVLINLTLVPGQEADALAILKQTQPVITLTLDSFDAAAQLEQLDELRIATDHTNKDSVKHLDEASQLWKDALDAQGLILEMISNLLVLGDDDNGAQGEFLEMEETEEGTGLEAFLGRPLFPFISKFIVESGIATRLLPKCIFVTRNAAAAAAADAAAASTTSMPDDHSESSSTAASSATDATGPRDDPEYLSLQQRAIGCLLNAVSNPEFAETTLSGASSLWRETCDHICAPAVSRTSGDLTVVHDILQNGLAVLNQVLRVVSASGDLLLIGVLPADLEGFIAIANSQSFPDQIRITSLTILGLLTGGPWVPTFDAAVGESLVVQILALFIDAMSGSSLILAAEAANALMDGFAEPTYNSVSQNLIPAVNKFAGALKGKIASERKNLDKILLDRIDETRVNLLRFVKYKNSQ